MHSKFVLQHINLTASERNPVETSSLTHVTPRYRCASVTRTGRSLKTSPTDHISELKECCFSRRVGVSHRKIGHFIVDLTYRSTAYRDTPVVAVLQGQGVLDHHSASGFGKKKERLFWILWSRKDFLKVAKINTFWGDQTDISAKKGALVPQPERASSGSKRLRWPLLWTVLFFSKLNKKNFFLDTLIHKYFIIDNENK